ncbi:hypothetical protein LCGC14_1605590 [marine sediment metagenome]|uniref:Uncharacterized protein n=1 Tax=marine sediment metagenome TaxID=412755 RepID=A0A0F9L9T0_9ZZZZ
MIEIILENQLIGKLNVRRKSDGEQTLSCGVIRSHKLKDFAGIRYKKIKISLEE